MFSRFYKGLKLDAEYCEKADGVFLKISAPLGTTLEELEAAEEHGAVIMGMHGHYKANVSFELVQINLNEGQRNAFSKLLCVSNEMLAECSNELAQRKDSGNDEEFDELEELVHRAEAAIEACTV